MLPMRAYIVREVYGDGCCVRFAAFNVVARREGANELDAEFGAVECSRYPDFDQYAETGVPDPVLVDHGWWFNCMHCGRKICNDPTDDDGESIELDPQYLGNRVFCTPTCHQAFDAERQAEQARADAAEQIAKEKWPGIEVVYKSGHEKPPSTGRVHFMFPGGEGSVDWTVGANVAYVQVRDVEAWEAFQAKVKADKEPV